MLTRIYASKGSDIGEFADPAIGDVGIAVAIAVIIQKAALDAAARTDLYITAKPAVGYLSTFVQIDFVGKMGHGSYRKNAFHRH